MMIDASRLQVEMTTALLKSTTQPLPSVSLPSPRTCSSALFTSQCVFSISSRQFSGGIRAFTALLIDHVVNA